MFGTGSDRSNLGRLRLLIPVIAIAMLTVGSYSAGVSISSSAYQAHYGVAHDATATFTGLDQGFTRISSSQTASPLACMWTTGGTCRTALTSGDLKYTVKVTLNTPLASATTYAVTIKWDNGGTGTSIKLCQLTVSVPTTASATQYMSFQCDTGQTSIGAPAAVDVAMA